MIDSALLLTQLQSTKTSRTTMVKRLEDDLRKRCDENPEVDAPLKARYDEAKSKKRTAATYKAWREDEITQIAVAWVLACVFIRFLEDNELVETPKLSGTGARLQRARDEHELFFREHPTETEREYLLSVFEETGRLPGMTEFFSKKHNPLWTAAPSGDACRELWQFWQKTDAVTGALVHDLTDPAWNTRFLGDLYQDLSEAARKRYALLQTPEFIEEFILDRTLTPAIETFGFREARLIDPTCGSGHFCLGAFERLFRIWQGECPGENPRVLAQRSLDGVFGVDLNPYAVAIARFRLLLAALKVCHIRRLADAPDFKIHLAVGDSLLHGARFDSEGNPYVTARQELFGGEEVFQDELRHHYEVEDIEALHRILGQQYHAVVGNPPYITVKDKAVSELYRTRFPSCHRAYSLSVPFMERFFDLAAREDCTQQQPAGFVGQITANSFMKREFGKKLIEEYLTRWNLTHVLDTSGAYIPGHGTPTVILFGKNQPPVSGTIRAVLSIRGEPATPENPSQGLVWQAICRQIDNAGSTSEWVSATDAPRANFQKHPWSIGGGGAAELKQELDDAGEAVLESEIIDVGARLLTRLDEVFELPSGCGRRLGGQPSNVRPFAVGEDVRDWQVSPKTELLYPYAGNFEPDCSAPIFRFLWRWRVLLVERVAFGKSQIERGLPWFGYSMLFSKRLRPGSVLIFSDLATHNHFAVDSAGLPANSHAPIIRLKPDGIDVEKIVGVLSSSLAAFWMKQVMTGKHKGDGGEAHASLEGQRFEFDGAKLKKFPLPARQPGQLPAALVQTSTAQQDQSPTATLVSWSGPESGDLRTSLSHAREEWHQIRRQMIAWQEELDWQIYAAYGLISDTDNLFWPEDRMAELPPLELGERTFEIVMARKLAAGELQTTWFTRHGSTPITEIPAHWPAAYREFVERRIRRIADDPNIRLIEQPEYKRRWNTEPWDDQYKRAARAWLLLRLETYFFGSERMKKIKNPKSKINNHQSNPFSPPLARISSRQINWPTSPKRTKALWKSAKTTSAAPASPFRSSSANWSSPNPSPTCPCSATRKVVCASVRIGNMSGISSEKKTQWKRRSGGRQTDSRRDAETQRS